MPEIRLSPVPQAILLNSGQKVSNGQIIPVKMDKVSAHGKKFPIKISMLKIGNGQKLPVRSRVPTGIFCPFGA
jgi:hypothetical protein